MSVTINNIADGSFAHRIGLRKGDVLVSINGKAVRDVIDYMYYSKDGDLELKIERGGRRHLHRIRRKDRSDLSFELRPFRTRSCRNKCVFCFVDQLPGRLRKTLYLKDEDYRMSFLYGNYITITNLSPADKKRIKDQRLSPLYVSVHTTNSDIRRKMLGNPRAPDILEEIRELTSHKIRIHAQIVLCPGLNDGEELSRTIRDLAKFYPYVASVAVVPVGLTKYRKSQVKPVEKSDALKVIDTLKRMRRRFKKRHGDPVVYLADEFFIKAGLPFPPLDEYGDLPQIENGVGMVPSFLHAARKLKLPKKIGPRKIVSFTGTAFMPYLREFLQRLKAIEGLIIDVFQIENKFFGSSVTVAGLLSGKDVLKALVGRSKADCLLVPNVSLKNGQDVFLDDVTLSDIQESLGMNVRAIDPTPAGLLRGIMDGCERKD